LPGENVIFVHQPGGEAFIGVLGQFCAHDESNLMNTRREPMPLSCLCKISAACFFCASFAVVESDFFICSPPLMTEDAAENRLSLNRSDEAEALRMNKAANQLTTGVIPLDPLPGLRCLGNCVTPLTTRNNVSHATKTN
jgi:hypothetical protein